MALTNRPPAPPLPVGAPDPELARVQRFARLLDNYFLDPILGLVVPGAGDLVGSMLGMYTVILAVRRRVSPVIIARMLMNLAVDAAIGVVPLAGDLFDLGFKANTKNVALLAERTQAGGRASAKDWLAVIGAGLAFLAVFALAIYAIVALVRAIA